MAPTTARTASATVTNAAPATGSQRFQPFWRRVSRWVLNSSSAAPATKGVRLHDLRHTAAVLWLTNEVHFIQVAKWLGHSSYVLTLTTYADYIPEQEAENPLPEPVAGPTAPATKVVHLFG